jgi:hypothetical protein
MLLLIKNMSSKSVCLNSSEIAIITGENTYQPLHEYIIKLWQKVRPDDYFETIKTLEDKHKVVFIPKETDKEIINKISKLNNINITKELKECLKTGTVDQLHQKKAKILSKFKDASKEQKKALTESLNNVVHTNFGTHHENNAIIFYEEKTGNKVLKDGRYHKRELFEYNGIKYYLGGKIDGYLEDKTIVEVKNRMYKLFGKLRNYEKTQIYAYLHIFNAKKAILLEKLKKKVDSKINIIEIEYKEPVFNDIKQKLMKFAVFFEHFLGDVDLKTMLLFGNEEQIEMFTNYVFNKINN